MLRIRGFGVVAAALVGSLALSCSEDDAGTAVTAAISQADLMGTWRLTQVLYSWDENDNGVRDQGSDVVSITDTSFIISIDQYQINEYDNTETAPCYYLVQNAYQLSGSSLIGDRYQGSWSEGDEVETWSTTVSMTGTTLAITQREAETLTGYSSTYVETQYFIPYAGPLPPADWPTCVYKSLQTRTRR
jgi:hypothetical protein